MSYTGEFKALGKVLLEKKPPAGEHKLVGDLKFQCNDQICKLPQTERFEIPFTTPANRGIGVRRS